MRSVQILLNLSQKNSKIRAIDRLAFCGRVWLIMLLKDYAVLAGEQAHGQGWFG
jgi:hypothetical protein